MYKFAKAKDVVKLEEAYRVANAYIEVIADAFLKITLQQHKKILEIIDD